MDKKMWTVARWPDGTWDAGGEPSDYDDSCEVYIMEGTDRAVVKRKAQGCRNKLRSQDKLAFGKLKAGDNLGHFGCKGRVVERRSTNSVVSGGDLFTLDYLRKMRMRYQFKTGLFTVALTRGSVR